LKFSNFILIVNNWKCLYEKKKLLFINLKKIRIIKR
jgi:hypothetical protein